MPNNSSGAPVFIAGFGGPTIAADFVIPFSAPPRYIISGITKDSTGTPLANCDVEVYETVSGLLRGTAVSDANGNYSLDVTGDGVVAPSDGEAATVPLTFFVTSYKAGGTPVSGTTVNTLVGA